MLDHDVLKLTQRLKMYASDLNLVC